MGPEKVTTTTCCQKAEEDGDVSEKKEDKRGVHMKYMGVLKEWELEKETKKGPKTSPCIL